VTAATREVTDNSYSPHSPPLPCPIQLPYPAACPVPCTRTKAAMMFDKLLSIFNLGVEKSHCNFIELFVCIRCIFTIENFVCNVVIIHIMYCYADSNLRSIDF
jgi:hypothetical protein